MTQTGHVSASEMLDPFHARERRSNLVRLRTLLLLRWIAITGQIVTVVGSTLFFGLSLEIGLVCLVIGAAVVTNLMASLVYPEAKRLSETEFAAALLFDMCQLSGLLMLSGGLNNPFSLLILAQVAIAAAALQRTWTLILSGTAVVLITTLLFVHLPLTVADGRELRLPELFAFGFWAAIVVGVIFQAVYARRVTAEVTTMADALTATQMALAREQKLTDLGGVVAAAAHELGTPLATIALVSGELLEEEDEDLRADARLIRDQAERCRVILNSMGRAGKQDSHIRRAPIASVVEEAAEPHSDRGVELLYDLGPGAGGALRQPVILRRPEFVHGMRNLLQNAVDFANARVWIDIRWTDAEITMRITDDGRGYPADLLPWLGDPSLRARREENPTGGMGLGLFIAKTLLERTGAEVTFANARDTFGPATPHADRTGALITLIWSRDRLIAPDDPEGGLEENTPIAR